MTHVVVVGAGVGGLSAATHLARRGLRVTVLERASRPGGRLTRFVRDGHAFDVGPTLLVMPHLYASELAALGSGFADLDAARVDPTYDIAFDDGSRLDMTSDLVRLAEQLERVEPGATGGLLRYLEEGRRHYDLGMPRLVEREFRTLGSFARPSMAPLAVRLHVLARHHGHMRRFFASDRLRDAFTFQDLYMGLSPFRAPATFSLMPYSELAHGVWYPRGGMTRIVDVLVGAAEAAGVDLRLGEPVRRVVIEGGRSQGVELEDGSVLAADAVLLNADATTAYRDLLPDRDLADRLARRRHSGSAISFFWGLDRELPGLAPHTLVLGDAFRAHFDAIERNEPLPDLPSVYLHAPSRLDPTAAPAGRDTLVAVVPTGHLARPGTPDADPAREAETWRLATDRARAAVLRRLALLGHDDVEDHLVVEQTATPLSWRDRGLALGATHGLAHTLTQLAYLRPHHRHARYPNVFFAGASTHPGTGVPTALVSGRLSATRLADEARA
jgi:phytoene desaturase